MINIFVIDTNTLISAHLLPGSVSRRAFDHAREIGIPVYSEATMSEFVETFVRPKFDKYISIEKRLKAISAFEKSAQLIHVSASITLCRDPKDNKFLELALDAGATCIITGDNDLLTLNSFENIPVITATDFLSAFK